jgi:cell division protein FtsQ
MSGVRSPARPSRGRMRRPPAQGSRSGATALGQEWVANTTRSPSEYVDERFRARRQAVRDAGVRRQRRLAGSIAALVVLGGGVTALTYSPLFLITDVAVAGVSPERAAEVEEAAAFPPGAHLLFTDLNSPTGRVEALPWVANATIRRNPPSTLEIAVTAREPAAVVRLSHASWLVDRDGVLIGGGAVDGLVQVDAPGAELPSVGQVVEAEAIRDALVVHAGLPAELRARVVRYDARADLPLRLLLRLDGEPAEVWVRVGDGTRIGQKGQAIALVLEQAQHDETLNLAGMELDVRAPENPVLDPVQQP